MTSRVFNRNFCRLKYLNQKRRKFNDRSDVICNIVTTQKFTFLILGAIRTDIGLPTLVATPD